VFKKSIALAIPALAATALVAASLSGGSVQANSDPQPKAAITKGAKAAKAVTLASCTGGAQKKAADRGVNGYVFTSNSGSDTSLIGSAAKFTGPNKGKDTISVNFSALAYAGTNYGQVKVLLDGIPMKPSDNVDGSWIYNIDEYGDFSRNYCARIGKGVHTVRVAYKTNSGGYLYLFDPMLHAEQSR
jgi:hypothetical protein